MQVTMQKLIGDESLFPVEHRIFNIILLIGILLSVSGGLINYCMDLGTAITSIIFGNGVFLGILYYFSMVKKEYSSPNVIKLRSSKQ